MLSRRAKISLAVVLSAFVGCNGPYNSGDRVLVDKFAYDAGVGEPRRFEVVVFKFPPTPVEAGVPKNYIKRLLGLPGEILAIFFGQIFTFHPDADEAAAFEDKDADPNDLWKWRYMYVYDGSDLNRADGLGVVFQDGITPRIRKFALRSPGEKSGLHVDDVITQIGDTKVASVEAVQKVVNQARTGETLVFKVQRGADLVSVNVRIGPNVLKYFDTPGKFKIVRKPPEVMMAMRRIVNDNDFLPSDFYDRFPCADGVTRTISKRWQPALGSGWQPDDFKGFVHNGDKQDVDWLRYQNVTGADLRGARPCSDPQWLNKPELINDFMDYNFPFKDRGFEMYPFCNWVGSLMSECQLKVVKPEGEFRMELSRSTFRYQARFELSSGQCTLVEISRDGSEKVLGKPVTTRVKGTGEYNLRFANFDSRLTVWVDEDLPFGEGVDYPPPVLVAPGETISEEDLLKRRGPTRENDLDRPASFGCSRGASVKIHHIRVWRDTYYSRNPGEPDFAEKITKEEFWRVPGDWAQINRIQPKIMYVQPGHYLCLGDNSPMSSDSRAGADVEDIRKQWGLVPQRLMLGRALVVYFPFWPFGPNRAGPIR